MDIRQLTQQCALVTVALLLLVGAAVQGYMGPSCRRCIHTGDWAACASCYNSRPGIVPFYGMSKRSGGNLETYPMEYDTESFVPDVPNVYEVRKRASSLVSYCCMHLHDDSCCNALGITPYFGKRSVSSDYDMFASGDCSHCFNRDTFDFSNCLKCLRKK